MERKDRIDAFAGSALLIFSALLGLNQVLVKLVNMGFSPVFQAGFRSLCALAPVLIYSVLMKKKLSISDGSLIPGIICGSLFSFEFLMLFQSLEYTSVSRASILFYTMPFWVAVGAHFFIPGERLTVIRTLGLGLAILGVVLAFYDKPLVSSDNQFLGDMLCLIAAIFWAGIALMVRATKLSRSSPEMLLIYQLVVSAAILLPIAPFFGDMIRDVTPLILAIFSFQVLVIVCVGFLTWFWILTIYPASDMAAFGFLAPIFGVFFGWLFLKEDISLSIIAALVLVSVGIALVNKKRRKT